MAFLPETTKWENGIYQIETTDYVIGGVDGVTNLPLKQLANRTLSLRTSITDVTEQLNVYKIATNSNLLGIHTRLTSLDTLTTTHTTTISTLDTRITSLETYSTETVVQHITSTQNPHQTTPVQIGALPSGEVSVDALADKVVRRNSTGKVVGDITGNAATVGGNGVSMTDAPSTIAVRDLNGVLVSESFKSTRTTEDSVAATAYVYDSGDGVLRKKAVEAARTELFAGVSLGNHVAALSGVAAHGTTLPLPAGYTKEQCFWVVGVGQFATFGGTVDTLYCYVDDNLVIHCYTTNGPANNGYANYLVIGIK